jgi:4'-phosphopantetheinyl transferase
MPAPRALDLPDGLALDLLTAAEGPDLALLSDAERERLDTLAHADRRMGFALGRTAARRLLARHLDLAPGAVPLHPEPGGRLVVSPGVHLSLAHAGRGEEAAAAAVVARGPVGVDLERVAPRHPDLWRRILRPDESGQLDALGGPSDDAQTLLWVLKEAVLKGQGTGFRVGARSVRLSLDEARAWSDTSGEWHLRFERTGSLWLAVAWQPPERG